MKKIMLVDDNALSVEGIHKNIDWEALGAQVTHIKYSGLSALKALEEDAKVFCRRALDYDLVLVPGDTFGARGISAWPTASPPKR